MSDNNKTYKMNINLKTFFDSLPSSNVEFPLNQNIIDPLVDDETKTFINFETRIQ